MFSSMRMTFLCADISCVETLPGPLRTLHATPGRPRPHRRRRAPIMAPGRPAAPGRMSPRLRDAGACARIVLTRRGIAPARRRRCRCAARSIGVGIGTPGRPAQYSTPVFGGSRRRARRRPRTSARRRCSPERAAAAAELRGPRGACDGGATASWDAAARPRDGSSGARAAARRCEARRRRATERRRRRGAGGSARRTAGTARPRAAGPGAAAAHGRHASAVRRPDWRR